MHALSVGSAPEHTRQKRASLTAWTGDEVTAGSTVFDVDTWTRV